MLVPADEGLREMYRKMGYGDCTTIGKISCTAGDMAVENATVAQLSGELIEFTATGGDHLIFLYPTRCAENKQ